MKPYVYAVFLRLPCKSILPRQRFHLADKLITAREFNVHVRPARSKYTLALNQHIRMISKGSWDTEDWSNDTENSACYVKVC